MTSVPVKTANPRRTTLAALRAGTRCEIAGPACRGVATRMLSGEDGALHACSACAAG